MEKLPQTLVNVRVSDRSLAEAAPVLEAVERESVALEGVGRVLLRPSGTEPLIRVMVEAPSAEQAQVITERLVDVLRLAAG
jgi:phosphoglucosamine mutase